VLAAYTLGHSIDNGSSQVDSGGPAPQNAYDFRSERGSSNFDVRNRFVVSSVYELPFGKGKPFLIPRAPADSSWEVGRRPVFSQRRRVYHSRPC